jgi:hypothetical protein
MVKLRLILIAGSGLLMLATVVVGVMAYRRGDIVVAGTNAVIFLTNVALIGDNWLAIRKARDDLRTIKGMAARVWLVPGGGGQPDRRGAGDLPQLGICGGCASTRSLRADAAMDHLGWPQERTAYLVWCRS